MRSKQSIPVCFTRVDRQVCMKNSQEHTTQQQVSTDVELNRVEDKVNEQGSKRETMTIEIKIECKPINISLKQESSEDNYNDGLEGKSYLI